MTDRPLGALCAAYGIATEYEGNDGALVTISDSTLTAVLRACDVDASTPEAIETALARRANESLLRPLPVCSVVRQGDDSTVTAHIPAGHPAALRLLLEDGTAVPLFQTHDVYPEYRVGAPAIGTAVFTIPSALPLGYHVLELTTDDETCDRAPLIVVPRFLGLPEKLGKSQVWGYAVQLYSVHSAGSWGLGDLVDLADLAIWSAVRQGADYLLTNPLHAAEPIVPMGNSPYSPSHRRFVHPIYVRPEAVAEYATADDATRRRVEDCRAGVLRNVDRAELIDRDAVWNAKIAALQAIYDRGLTPLRQVSYEGFIARGGQALRDFAIWCALTERFGHDHRTWPEQFSDPSSDSVEGYATEHRDRVDFFCWLQWVANEQLAAAQEKSVSAGMRIGILNDVAVGVSAASTETWSQATLFAQGVSVGAPPDAYNTLGQDWGQSPWRPDRLAELGYAPFRDMIRTMLAHCGGLRVDHIIGLFRLWWIPDSDAPTEGTYVRYDHDALVGILMLEAQRANAVVVGEDLGTVEPWVRDYLAQRGVLGTSVLWFERSPDGSPLAPERYREYCMASITTHDLAPTAGYLQAAHLGVRDRLGLLRQSLAAETAQHEADLQRWLDLLARRGVLHEGAGEDRTEDEILALHRLLRSSPSRVINVALTDAVGDRRMQNQPGTVDQYPNWRIPLSDSQGVAISLEDLVLSERAARLGAVLNEPRDLFEAH